MGQLNYSLAIADLHARYKSGEQSVATVCADIRDAINAYRDYNIWLYCLSDAELQPYLQRLVNKSVDELPLYGVPFAIKDNIDLASIPTTAACPEFSYVPDKSAYIVQLLIDAGAIPIGKTNMDQFATGLVGTRSPYGVVKNAFDPTCISGGSSSGSAVAVALGLVSFALGTDTAGSGRVPAMLNNIYGLKPSRGLLSMSGIVPACRSLDCPSIFSLSVTDATTVFNLLACLDVTDSYARNNPFANSARCSGVPVRPPAIAVPIDENLEFFGDSCNEALFFKVIDCWKTLGASIERVDIQPLLDAAKLLYQGPWVAERYAAIESTIRERPAIVHPVVREILQQAENKTAIDTFKYAYKMQAYRRKAIQLLAGADFLVTPTAPTSYSIDQMLDDPISLNANMGYYTNYMNLLDLCGVAVPAFSSENGQQFGVTLVGEAFQDQKLLGYAHQWQRYLADEHGVFAGASGFPPSLVDVDTVEYSQFINIAVCGAHLSGMPLNWQLTERGATLISTTTTAACYRLYALQGGPPYRPGLMRDDSNGEVIEVEVWSIPATEFGSFVASIPSPLGIGRLELIDGSAVSGFICEYSGIEGAHDITHLGGWRNYIHHGIN